MTKAQFQPEGWPRIIPRIVTDDPEALVAFVKHVFKAEGRYNPERPTDLQLGDSMIMIHGTKERDKMPAFLYVYTENTDLAYRRALESGATSMEEPQDQFYGDRRAMVRDKWGNLWQIATHSGRFTA